MFRMANEDSVHRCVTKFMLNTCRYSTDEYAELGCAMRTAVRFLNEHNECFKSGSSAEFHIKPMLSCIGDVDIMITKCNVLVIPDGSTPPTELPSHYKQCVYVLEMIDSEETGYVYLRLSFLLSKDDNGRYVAEKIQNSGNKERFIHMPSACFCTLDQC